MTSKLVVMGLVAVASCAVDQTEPVEDNALGIARLEIARHAQGDERTLEIRGFDAAGNEVASADLRIGIVSYSSDPGLLPEALSAGSELVLRAGADSITLTDPDRTPHAVDEPRIPGITAFVRLDAVRRAIKDDIGIWFEPVTMPTGETAYTTTWCDASRFPSSQPETWACCKEGTSSLANTYHVVGYPSANFGKVSYRKYNVDACRRADFTVGCTTDCFYGPCTGGSVWQKGAGGDQTSRVFYPTSNTNVCGWDSITQGYSPEPWNGQTMYPNTMGTCPYTGCHSDGTPF